MESLEILERKIRENLDKTAKIAEERDRLSVEIKTLRESIAALEAEKHRLQTSVGNMIRMIEQHLGEQSQ